MTETFEDELDDHIAESMQDPQYAAASRRYDAWVEWMQKDMGHAPPEWWDFLHDAFDAGAKWADQARNHAD